MSSLVLAGREFASAEAFGGEGRRCGTPLLNDFEKARIRAHRQVLRLVGVDAEAVGALRIPVRFHVIHDGNDGNIPQTQIDAQIDVLNQTFQPHAIQFDLVYVDHTNDPVWFQMTMGSVAERQAKTALAANMERELNFYTGRLGSSLLGWATFPAQLAGDPIRDGVVVLDSSLPGGTFSPYDLGMTAVHEVGHWLGLYHTFEGGCHPPGDEVDDTPFEASPNYGPANPRDTCPQPGSDPVTNYMDYTDDAGMTEFTPGQIRRIREQVALYRPLLLAPPVAAKLVAPAEGAEAAAGAEAFSVDMLTGAF